ncbi:hypothetical protein Nepgr_014974 [Nepenthes gracilis]|uniref:Uncharacterized protein n=1 Tax=Nepenthes gracilis TaxID=150966 RepID=A0AAD3SL30_NEPGR|nr:hypothetical protein Nepgr_014974 [Nepenthes gracilis]
MHPTEERLRENGADWGSDFWGGRGGGFFLFLLHSVTSALLQYLTPLACPPNSFLPSHVTAFTSLYKFKFTSFDLNTCVLSFQFNLRSKVVAIVMQTSLLVGIFLSGF